MSEINLSLATESDSTFLKAMLYEAVFWRKNANTPTLQEFLNNSDFDESLRDWGQRTGDTAVIAKLNGENIGAAWFRYWTDEINDRGYIKTDIPVLIISIKNGFRNRGVGQLLIEEIFQQAISQNIANISLRVATDNVAFKLYTKMKFKPEIDHGDSITMLKTI